MSDQPTSGPYQKDRKQIPDVIYYMASRLRAASIKILNAKKDTKKWMYPLFLSELQFALSFIGMSAAIGQSCDIPIILRTLACQLYQTSKPFTLEIDRNFLLGLDAGSDPEDMAAAVDSYHLGWWTLDHKPKTDCAINFSTIDTALDYHRSITANTRILPIKLNKEKYTWPRHVSFDPKGLSLDCENCRLYRGVSLGVLDNVQDLRHQVHGLEVLSENHADMSERRAAGFFQLYEAALAKESDEIPISKTSGKRNKKKLDKQKPDAEHIRKGAAAEFQRLKDLPSLKWTWGPDLTIEDVLNLSRIQLPSRITAHSGYNHSLPWGSYAAASSGSASISAPSPSHIYSEIGEDITVIPLLDDNDIPTDFMIPPLRNLHDDPHPLKMPTEDIDPTWPPGSVYSWLEPSPPGYFPAPPDVIRPFDSAGSSLSNESVPACNVYSDKSSDDDFQFTGQAAALAIVDEDLSDQAAGSVNIPDDNASLSSLDCHDPYAIYSTSDANDDDMLARDVFSSSDEEIDNVQAAAVFSDSDVNIQNHTPSITGPFTPQFFSNIPTKWLPVNCDEHGNICYDSD